VLFNYDPSEEGFFSGINMKEKYNRIIAHSSVEAYRNDGDDEDRYYIPWRVAAEAAGRIKNGERVLTVLPRKDRFNEYLTLLSEVLLKGTPIPTLFTPDNDYLMDVDIRHHLLPQLSGMVDRDTTVIPYQATNEFYDWAQVLEQENGIKIYADRKREDLRFWWGHKGAYHRWMDDIETPSPYENIGISIPRGYIAQNYEELEGARSLLGSGIVVKPIFGAGGFQIEKFGETENLSGYDWPIDPHTKRNMPVAVQECLPISNDIFGERVYSHQFAGQQLQGRLTRQIMDFDTGRQWIGNRIPAGVSVDFERKADRLCEMLIDRINPLGDGGIDLAEVLGEPVLIEVNGGRPTGATGPKIFQASFAPDAPHFIFTKVAPNGYSAHDAWDSLHRVTAPRSKRKIVFQERTRRGVFPMVWLNDSWGMLASFGDSYEEADSQLKQARDKLGV